MFRRNFLQLPIFGFLGSKIKNNIESKLDIKQEDLEKWEHPPIKRFGYDLDEEISKQIEDFVLNWLKNTDESMHTIPMIRGDLHPTCIMFVRSVINIKSGRNTWDQWHIATSSDFPKIISTQIKTVGINNTKLIDDGFTMPNEVKSERYDGTSYI